MPVNRVGMICSNLLIALGSVVLIGWITETPILVQLFPNMISMVPNTAISFIFIGIGLSLSFTSFHYRIILQQIIFLIVLILTTASLSQDIFHYKLGIDHWLLTSWMDDPNPAPGRMAPNTSIGFMLSSLIGILTPYGKKRPIAVIIQFLTLIVFLIAVIGILIYSLNLEFIFGWYRYTRMALHTALGLVITSVALWESWGQSDWYKEFYRGKEDKKIILITGTILLCITLISGFGGVASLTYLNLISSQQSLKYSLENKVNVLIEEVNLIQQNISFAINNSILSEAILHPYKINNLKKAEDFLNKKEFTEVQLKDSKNNLLLDKENIIEDAESSVLLNLPYQATIFWNNGFWLKFTSPVNQEKNGAAIGSVTSKIPLKAFNKIYQNYNNLGDTGELVICSKLKENYALCFPSRFTSNAFVMRLVSNGKLLPMQYALDGKTGAINTIDHHNHNVIAAYSPIDNTNLGIVLTIETSEIYKPLRDQLQFILPTVFLLVCCGLILLNWQVAPLVRKVFFSEKEALEANKKLARKNLEIHLLRELGSLLQSCQNLPEAVTLIIQQGCRLFPNISSSLYLMNDSYDQLESILTWGNVEHSEKAFKPNDCWALRRGSMHNVGNSTIDLVCFHSKMMDGKIFSSACIPMLAQTDLIGLFYLEWNPEQKNQVDIDLAITLSEQLALAISNIKLRETLRNQSIHDPLTGLYNRRYLEETISREVNRAKRNSLPFAICILDVDKFKEFNDTFGHEAGDIVLQGLGTLLNSFIRVGDTACRYGGEEFVIVLPETSMKDALKQAERLHQQVSHLQLNYQQKILGKITISIGIAIYPEDGVDSQSLINAADIALYQAKNSGRNKTVCYKKNDS